MNTEATPHCVDCHAQGIETPATHNIYRSYPTSTYDQPRCDACKARHDEESRAQWEAERAKQRAKREVELRAHDEYCEAIAAALSKNTGKTWKTTVQTNRDGERFNGAVCLYRGEALPDFTPGRPLSVPTVAVSTQYNKPGRIEFQGSLQGCYDYLPYKADNPSATATRTKKPEQIAREIERKILPAYLELFEKAQASYRATLTREDTVASTARALIEASAGKLSERAYDEQKPITDRTLYVQGTGGYGTWSVRNDSVSIELSYLSPDKALQIAQLMATWKKAD